ncbi:HD domain-containing phosphohydrolase [Pelomonas sp. SE-A7]|uniref:HD domain-containing phosphohydrolase n=1 Tax=Pelomonas sp. SE-A7 TaxID=3054953 RepID=UPI00259CD123|nr:HD domain-containing phosphohydrolase [Pelomonas sp. SE-A7]MDM4766138.1 HD domain-containing phosphohydrolase [Pelomonas sp. SE-A7]
MPPVKPRSIYVTLSVLMVGIVLLLYVTLLAYQLQAGKQRMLIQAAGTFEHVSREASAAIEAELRPARLSAALLAQTRLIDASDEGGRLASLPVLTAALRENPSLSAAYGGTAKGSFLLLRRLDSRELGARLDAPHGAAYLLQTVDRDREPLRARFSYYDAQMQPLSSSERGDYRFDPRERPWFTQALARPGQVIQTAPYMFFTTREVGLTLASARGEGAAGVDVSLAALGAMLARQRITASAELMIVDERGQVLAGSLPARQPAAAPVADESAKLLQVAELGSPVMLHLWTNAGRTTEPIFEQEGREWVARLDALPGTPGLSLAVAAPRDELQADILRARGISILITAGIVLLTLPIVHWAAKLVARPLKQLAREAEAIRRFDFAGPDPARSHIKEVDLLALSMTSMKHSLRRFLDISTALSAERNVDRLLDRILAETLSVAQAASGAIHLLSPDGKRLVPAATRIGEEVADPSGLSEWDMEDADSLSVSVAALRSGCLVERELRWDNPAHLAAYAGAFRRLNTAKLRLVGVPLLNRKNEMIGALSLGFLDGDGETGRLASSRAAFIEALAGPAAVAIDNQQLLRAQKELLQSFIELVAGAIDAKSPYTGGHCQRVPELTKLLARAACEAKEGPYAGYSLSEEQWEELHIAAWLHDCGKVTTPEYVVDKATKLETLCDRIHEVRMRFELLKREAYVEQCERELEQRGADLAQLRDAVAPAQRQLDEEFAFVASCNEGGEYLSPDKVQRLREIGARRWWRTLDDRLGTSQDERRRKSATPAPPLPVQEPLLADKPEHLLPRPPGEKVPEGFKVRQPEHLYNRGELYNLSLGRGTLTEEERYKINDHIVQTIRMLEALPLPRHLRRVPEIAGGHHEKLDGSGYPKGLTREQMSPEARMMAIADVFEALTADDRPYKKGKTLSEAMAIMVRMRREQHLDAELFELFLRSGAYLDYAKRFMKPAQIDEVDLAACLA